MAARHIPRRHRCVVLDFGLAKHAVDAGEHAETVSIESAMQLQVSARTLTPFLDLRQQLGGCVSDSDELV